MGSLELRISKAGTMKVYTGGTFDLFHAGHVELLRKCAQLGEVTVALNTDEFILSYKGKAPIMTFGERAAVLEGCQYVAHVVPNTGGADSKPAIESASPDVIVVGSDWAKRDYYSQMQFTQEWLDDRGIWLCYVPYTAGISSTEVKRRLAN